MKKVLLLLMILIPMNVFAEDITANSKITVNDVVNSKLTDKDQIKTYRSAVFLYLRHQGKTRLIRPML